MNTTNHRTEDDNAPRTKRKRKKRIYNRKIKWKLNENEIHHQYGKKIKGIGEQNYVYLLKSGNGFQVFLKGIEPIEHSSMST